MFDVLRDWECLRVSNALYALASAVPDLCSGRVREQKAAGFVFGFPKATDQ